MCGSVFGLDMIASAFTYLPPIWLITSAYSFSAPIAVILVADAAAAVELPPAALDEDDEDEQALTSRAAASGRATAKPAVRVLMTLYSQMGKAPPGGAGVENEYRYGNHFH